MIQILCDACGKPVDRESGHGAWEIGIRFRSMWNQEGDVRVLQLCSTCGSHAAKLLGFCYDTGKILSLARGEMVDGVEVHGPNGGGLEDIAINGIGGSHGLQWHAEKPNALVAGEMGKR